VTDRYAVVGNPVAHSKSPWIHAQFARQTGEDIEYGRILAPLDGFRATVDEFRHAGGKGLNVTLPFKLEAFALATQHSQPALDAGAVNVLKFEAQRIEGYNTDGVGLVRDVESNLGWPIAGRRVLLMGAGGAAQGTVGPLLEARPAALTIANRTLDKAQRLVQRFAQGGRFPGTHIAASDYAGLSGQAFDLVVNATSASLSDTVPALPAGVFAPGSLAYDMMYGKGLTPFLALAGARGAARLADGIGMLVEQAAESFLIWRGVRPRTDELIAQLKTAR
jgi:shikimate dehydrogenase